MINKMSYVTGLRGTRARARAGRGRACAFLLTMHKHGRIIKRDVLPAVTSSGKLRYRKYTRPRVVVSLNGGWRGPRRGVE